MPAKPGGTLLLQTRLDSSIVCHTELRVSRTAAGKGQYAIAAGGRQAAGSLLVHDNGGSLGGHLCSCSQSDDKHEADGGAAASSKLCGPDVAAWSCSSESERWDGDGVGRRGLCSNQAGTAPLRPWRACRSASGSGSGMAGKVWGCHVAVAVWACLLAPSLLSPLTRCCILFSAKPRRAPTLPLPRRSAVDDSRAARLCSPTD